MQFTLRQATLADGRRIGYREAGDGAPLVMAHGIGSGSASFSAQLAGLADAFRVVSWDAPGYGGSDDHPAPEPRAADYAHDLVALLDALALPRVHLLCHSMGGLIAASVVTHHAERVDALVLSACASGYARLDAAARAARLDARVEQMTRLGPARMAEHRAPGMLAPGADEAARAEVTRIMAALRPDGYLQACRLLGAGDVFAAIRGWPATPPTLVLAGRDDRVTPLAEVRRIAHGIAGARLQTVDGAGHAAYLERPQRYNALVREFLLAAAPDRAPGARAGGRN